MASLAKDKSGTFLVKFRFGGKEFTKSLGTKEPKDADRKLGEVSLTLERLKSGLLTMPPDAEPGVFITSAGRLTTKPVVKRKGSVTTPPAEETPFTLADLIDRWRTGPGGKKRENTALTIRIHLAHVANHLGSDRSLKSITRDDLKAYAEIRGKQPGNDGTVRPYTVRKELRTFRQIWEWAHGEGFASAAPTWEVKSIVSEPDSGGVEFRTYEEIDRKIKRGGLNDTEQARLWRGLYLTADEVSEVLEHVKANATVAWFYPMVAFCAMTGARRAELLRSEIDDWDFATGVVHIRELKRVKNKESKRTVAIHPRLAAVMQSWFADHPGGQFTIAQNHGGPVPGQVADAHFGRVLGSHPKWDKIRGFHVFRHSFASILASKGVDPRIIDSYMGHVTEEMRKHYSYVMPQNLKRAIEELF